MIEVKVGKLPVIASTCNFMSKLLQGGKIW